MCSQVHDLLRTGSQAPAVPSRFTDRKEVQGASGVGHVPCDKQENETSQGPPVCHRLKFRAWRNPRAPTGPSRDGVVVMLLLHGTCQLLHHWCSVTLRHPWLSIPRGCTPATSGPLSAELRGCCLHRPAQCCLLGSNSFPAPSLSLNETLAALKRGGHLHSLTRGPCRAGLGGCVQRQINEFAQNMPGSRCSRDFYITKS